MCIYIVKCTSFPRAQLPLSFSLSYFKAKWFNISLSVTVELSPTSECISASCLLLCFVGLIADRNTLLILKSLKCTFSPQTPCTSNKLIVFYLF